jgi:hypothetical protein
MTRADGRLPGGSALPAGGRGSHSRLMQQGGRQKFGLEIAPAVAVLERIAAWSAVNVETKK